MRKISTISVLLALVLAAGLFFRFYNLNFGLPQSFRADEPELVEPAIFYTYEIRNIIRNGDYYQLIPISYVYGTFPAYFLTIFNMVVSKTHNILNLELPKENMYLFIRGLHALISMAIAVGGALIYKKLFKDRFGALLTFFFLSLNWKLIVHGHYANADLIITALLTFSALTLFGYYKKRKDSSLTLLTGVLFGLAVGTKITALLSLPLFLYVFIVKKDWRGTAGFILISFAVFLFTNPFSFIFVDSFLLRMLELITKESRMVLDSVDLNPFKYIVGLLAISTPLVVLLSVTGITSVTKLLENKQPHVFLIGNIIIYLVFFSLSSRRVDRWLLPILPFVAIYAGYAASLILSKLQGLKRYLFILLIAVSTLYFPALLLGQFQREVPKSQAYYWAQENLPSLSSKLVITEEGLDPMNKIKFAEVIQYPVYTSEGAQFFTPPNLDLYDYVILSSRPMENFKRQAVKQSYPYYSADWEKFEGAILDSGKYKLLKSFVLPKPNLVPLSDVFIYERL